MDGWTEATSMLMLKYYQRTFSNNSCFFASYSRDETKPSLDYAIVPPVTEKF
jgi:hypothetical protein